MREIKFKAVMQRLDGAMYVSEAYGMDSGFLSYLFDTENDRWDEFLETITTERRFVELFPDEDEHLKGWSHIENIQYTGLKDKNKEEIYEGYILNCGNDDFKWSLKNGYVGSVIFDNGTIDIGVNGNEYSNFVCGFIVEPIYTRHSMTEYCTGEFVIGNSEIVGNIYENHELIPLEV